jgi:hypothetical protein
MRHTASVPLTFTHIQSWLLLNTYFNVTGTVRADVLPYLLTIDDASFGPAGVLLANSVHLFQCQNCTTNLTAIITELASKGINILNVTTATGKNVWVSVRTADEFTHDTTIPGIITF